jgi:DNA-binding CsgD family transcriptional regulator
MAMAGTIGTQRLSPTLFRKTGLLFACLLATYIFLAFSYLIFNKVHSPFLSPLPISIAILLPCTALFIFSALYEKLAWIQPIILLILSPMAMTQSNVSMYSLGFFIAAEILLFRLGFFETKKVNKFVITVTYFYLCEILIGLTMKADITAILYPLLFITVFLFFLMVVYGDSWIVYLKEPKPSISLSSLSLTKMELVYLRALLEGASIKAIAIDRRVKESTVRNTLVRVYRKFGVPDKASLLTKCESYELID